MRSAILATAVAIALAASADVASAEAPRNSSRHSTRAPKPPPDSCVALRKPFQRVKDAARTQVIVGGILGAAGGFLAAKQQHATNDQTTRMILGGMTLGAMAGYFNARRQQGETAAQLQASVADDFEPRVAMYSKIAENLADLGNCRRGQVFAIQQDYEAHAATVDESRTRLAWVQRWIEEDDVLVSAVAKTQSQRVASYAQAYGLASGMSEAQVTVPSQAISNLGEAQINRYEGSVAVDAASEANGSRAANAGQNGVFRYAKPAGGARLRSTADTAGAQIAMIPQGAAVEVANTGSGPLGWSEVRWNGKTGFVRNDLLSDKPPSINSPKVAPPSAPPKRSGPRTVLVRPSAKPAPVTPVEHAQAAAAAQRTVERTRQADRTATASALAEAQALLGRV